MSCLRLLCWSKVTQLSLAWDLLYSDKKECYANWGPCKARSHSFDMHSPFNTECKCAIYQVGATLGRHIRKGLSHILPCAIKRRRWTKRIRDNRAIPILNPKKNQNKDQPHRTGRQITPNNDPQRFSPSLIQYSPHPKQSSTQSPYSQPPSSRNPAVP